MIVGQSADMRPWLLVDASQEGMLRLATANPSDRPRVENIRHVEVAGVPTFTDALQRYEREAGLQLRGLQCCMAMAGATSGDSLSLVRSRWTISRAGLEAIFDRPAIVLNDVAARAWGVRAGSASVETLRGTGAPSFGRTGRLAMLMVEEGVNAAVVDIDRDGQARVLETEGGKLDFAPTDERELKLAQALRGISASTIWEQMLMLERDDPVWRDACPEVAESERLRILASVLGRFCVNLMHVYGAWQGVMITGSRGGRILNASARAAFDASFVGRRSFSRLIANTPVWRVDQNEAVLTGAAERLAHDFRPELRAAA